MAKMTFKGGTENPAFKMTVKQNKYRERQLFWFRISMGSISINITLIIFIGVLIFS